MIKSDTIEQFLEKVASKAPTPGGGAVAAVTGAMAAALVEMVVGLTKNEELKTNNFTKLRKLRADLLELADKDVEAFNNVMAAYKISKEDKDRSSQIQSALKVATEVPLKTAVAAYEVNKLAKEVLKTGNKNASSDARTAIYLSEAAIKSALENVKINLASIKDRIFVGKIEEAVAKLKGA